MKRKAKKSTPKKEEIAEDWCFVCKDGGLLLICDYRQCLKAYHPNCVGKDDSFLDTGNRWTCKWHSCFVCKRTPNFHCYCCPNAVCRRCITAPEFAQLRGKKGFCNNCLKLALLVEDNKDVDSDGEQVDFKDRETYEGLFMEYYEIIKAEECLTTDDIRSAKARLNIASDEFDEDEENELMSDQEYKDDTEHKPGHKRKRYKGQKSALTIKVKPNKKEFNGWASKPLIQFLTSIGRDTSEKLSHHDVTGIINGYIKENKLFHPERKRKIMCDERLQTVLGRKMVNKHRIHDLLEEHFAENQEQSEEDELGDYSEDGGEALEVCKRQKKSSTERKFQKEEVEFNVPQTCFAKIVAENIKLVYLRRSLVQELLRQPDTFESKVVGGFVRVKSDPNDYLRRNSHELMQVTGIQKVSTSENTTEILLQISDMPNDVSISMLSDDNFSQEECEDLGQKVKGGLLKKPTIAELEQKVRSLHEDITKHWIARELNLLQKLIDRANEKGWRREFFEYMERKKLLQTPSEQSRLLQVVPTVIPDVEEHEAVSEDIIDDKQGDKCSPKSILMGSSELVKDQSEGKGISSVAEEKKHYGCVGIAAEKQHLIESSVLHQHSHLLVPETKHNVLQRQLDHDAKEKHDSSKAYTLGDLPQQECHIVAPEDKSKVVIASTAVDQPIELNGDDKTSLAVGRNKHEDPEISEWHCLGPNGETKGPHSLSVLKNWSEASRFALKFKVWKASQSEENAISLTDAINLAFPTYSRRGAKTD